MHRPARRIAIAALLGTMCLYGCEGILGTGTFTACCLRISPNPAVDGESIVFPWDIESTSRVVRWTVFIGGDVVDTGRRSVTERDEWTETSSTTARRVLRDFGETAANLQATFEVRR